MRTPQIPNFTLAIKVSNGRFRQLHSYVRIKVVIASVEQTIEAYVIPGLSPSYQLLLSRQWLREVKVIGDYATDDCWITDKHGDMHQLVPTSIIARKLIAPDIPRISLSAPMEATSCGLDDTTIDDLTDPHEADQDGIWDEVIKEAKQEEWQGPSPYQLRMSPRERKSQLWEGCEGSEWSWAGQGGPKEEAERKRADKEGKVVPNAEERRPTMARVLNAASCAVWPIDGKARARLRAKAGKVMIVDPEEPATTGMVLQGRQAARKAGSSVPSVTLDRNSQHARPSRSNDKGDSQTLESCVREQIDKPGPDSRTPYQTPSIARTHSAKPKQSATSGRTQLCDTTVHEVIELAVVSHEEGSEFGTDR